MTRPARLALCSLIGVCLAALPGCDTGARKAADGRPPDAPELRPAGTRMMASDYVGGMIFTQPKRPQGDTSFATVPVD
jgi:hypothetical protein